MDVRTFLKASLAKGDLRLPYLFELLFIINLPSSNVKVSY